MALAACAPLIPMRNAFADERAPSRPRALDAMRRATRFMVETASTNGGYVWSYLADFSRRWGEMEAYPSMIWTQAPGTPEMGQIFLDAYHATGDEYYYQAAERAADALIWGQHETGGWNYIIDFNGEESLRRWYETIGKNGWRLEEFQHYYGNATFDDHATAESGRLLLRIYLEKRDAKFRAPLDKAIDFVLRSQYPSGGWPQRFPRMGEFRNHGNPDYSGYVTLNDQVAEQNIDFLLLALQQLGDERVREPIQRAMACYITLQQPAPRPGWAQQYTPQDLQPAAARTYEPRSITPHGTRAAIEKMMDFYELTGDRRYLARVPEAIDWLISMEAPAEIHGPGGRNYFRNYEVGTGRIIATRRRGSNAQNGEYYHNFDPTGLVGQLRIETASLRPRYERLAALTPEQAAANSVMFGRGPTLLPRFVVTHDIVGSDLNTDASAQRSADTAHISALIAGLNAQGYWPTELRTTSHPYRGNGPSEPPPGFVDSPQVGDEWDTSPFTLEHGPMGISTGTYIRNMSMLIQFAEGGA
jgi:hypothetical protein